MKRTLPLLALAATCFAADAPKPQIIIEARFTETDAKSGKEDVLSAPRVTTREGQAATIEIVREVLMSIADSQVKDAVTKFKTGVELNVTGWIEGENLILRGAATVRELGDKIVSTKDASWTHLRTDEVPFVLRLKDGEPRQLPISSSARSDRKLKIEITARKHVPVNASPLYWQAFAAIPKFEDAEKKLLDSKTAGDAERALVTKADAALGLLVQASAGEYCDWNLDLTRGPSLQLPHLGPARELAKLALLRARVRAAEGDMVMALEDPLAVMHFARHVASTPLLISRLVGVSIEAMAVDTLASFLPRLSDDGRRRLQQQAIEFLAPVPTVSDCLVEEGKSMGGWMTRELDAEVKRSGATLDVRAWLGRLLSGSGQNADETLKQMGSLPKDEAGVRQLIGAYRTQMQELARIIGLPHEEMRKQAQAFEENQRSGSQRNVFVALLAPSVMKARESELKGETRLALLRAALEVQAKGETALPVGLATYRKTDRGFELTSKELFSGKPVVLTVGPR